MDEFLVILNESRIDGQVTFPLDEKKEANLQQESPDILQTNRENTEKPIFSIQENHLPPINEVKKYILTQPNFAHTLFDLQNHFYGKEFHPSDRTEKEMYHKTFRQAARVRSKIEIEKGGTFIVNVGKNRKNEYVFLKAEQKREQLERAVKGVIFGH